jgi:iron complex transport system substrate-binding protein
MTLRPRFTLLAAAAALLLAGCGLGTESGEASGENAWTYTSGDGKTYTAEEVPTRIIAQGESAAALIAHGIRPVGIFLSQPLEDTKSLQGLDLDGIEIIGETWGKIDAEKAASLEPDLIVSGYWTTEKAYGGLENGVEESSKKVAKLAPVVGPVADQSVEKMLDGFEELSGSLGADLDSAEQARERFKTTVAEADGLTAMGVSPADDILYVAVPKHSAELADFARYGLDIVVPDFDALAQILLGD